MEEKGGENPCDILTFEVSCGKKFRTYRRTILNQDTVLKDLVLETSETNFLIDEDKKFFRILLDFHRTGLYPRSSDYFELDIYQFKIDYWGLSKGYSELDFALYFLQNRALYNSKTDSFYCLSRSGLNITVNFNQLFQVYGFQRWTVLIHAEKKNYHCTFRNRFRWYIVVFYR